MKLLQYAFAGQFSFVSGAEEMFDYASVVSHERRSMEPRARAPAQRPYLLEYPQSPSSNFRRLYKPLHPRKYHTCESFNMRFKFSEPSTSPRLDIVSYQRFYISFPSWSREILQNFGRRQSTLVRRPEFACRRYVKAIHLGRSHAAI